MGLRGPKPGTIRKPPRVFSPALNCPERRYMLVARGRFHVSVMRDCRAPLLTAAERLAGRCRACSES